MQYAIKGIRGAQWGLEQSPQKLQEFSRIFVLKVILQSVVLLLSVSYKKIGKHDVLLAPPIILSREQLLPLLPRFPCLWLNGHLTGYIEMCGWRAVSLRSWPSCFCRVLLTWRYLTPVWTLRRRKTRHRRIHWQVSCGKPACWWRKFMSEHEL